MTTVKKHVCEKRVDERGWVIDPIVPSPGGEPLGHAHLASLEPGAIRGNHVHSGPAEFVLVWGWRVEIAWEEGGRLDREEVGDDSLVVFEQPFHVDASANDLDPGIRGQGGLFLREGIWPASAGVAADQGHVVGDGNQRDGLAIGGDLKGEVELDQNQGQPVDQRQRRQIHYWTHPECALDDGGFSSVQGQSRQTQWSPFSPEPALQRL